jgi:hypothetical protein
MFGSSAPAQHSSAPATAITDASRAEAVHFLRELVKIDTSNPPGNELKAANYIKSILDKEGIASERSTLYFRASLNRAACAIR